MKKNRRRAVHRIHARKSMSFMSRFSRRQVIFAALFVLIMLVSVGLRIYKARYAGMTYDETRTFYHYGNDLNKALHSYTSTNNHILNSVMIYYAYRWFGDLEHFIRLPSLIAGIWFVLVTSYIVLKTVKNDVLRLVALAWAISVPLVFDYSYLARGNAMALAAIYSQIAFTIYLLDHKVRFRFFWAPALFIAAMNFIAFGAMLSSALTQAAFNLCYCLIYCHHTISLRPQASESISRARFLGRWSLNSFLNSITILIASACMLYPLYHGVLDSATSKVVRVSSKAVNSGYPDFAKYIYKLLGGSIFRPDDLIGKIIFAAVMLLIVVCPAFFIWKFYKAARNRQAISYINKPDAGNLVILVTALTVAFLFVYNVVFGRVLALTRYHVYIIPVFVLSVVIVIDRFFDSFKETSILKLARKCTAVLLITAILHNLPSHINVLNGSMSISRPLLVRLKKKDPDKAWKISFSKKMRYYYMGFTYYMRSGYKFSLRFQGPPDVVVLGKNEELPKNAISVDRVFFDKAGCAVVFNRPGVNK